jgi:hypothetical protein
MNSNWQVTSIAKGTMCSAVEAMRRGYPVMVIFWEVDGIGRVVSMLDWRSDAVPTWVLAAEPRYVVTGLGTFDPTAEHEVVSNGGMVPGSLDHDFARLRVADVRLEVTP